MGCAFSRRRARGREEKKSGDEARVGRARADGGRGLSISLSPFHSYLKLGPFLGVLGRQAQVLGRQRLALLLERLLHVDQPRQLVLVVLCKVVAEQLVQALVQHGQVRLRLGAVGVLDKHLVHERVGLKGQARAGEEVRDGGLHDRHHVG